MRGRAGVRGHRGHRKLSPTEDLELAKPFLDRIAAISPPSVERQRFIEHFCTPPTAQKLSHSPRHVVRVKGELDRQYDAPNILAYFKLLRIAAQACGTPESTALLPGITAQPPFST